MKKLFTLVAVASMFTFVACGPSEAEKKAAAQKITDSTNLYNEGVAAAEAATKAADSVAAAEKEAAAAAEATRIADSTAAAAKAPKGKKK
ncbi:MAG: hypothetical protein NTX97_11485 [Bacteroidetes bacterium]|nr:hypothetical protein [Bacteroidota bacterium]